MRISSGTVYTLNEVLLGLSSLETDHGVAFKRLTVEVDDDGQAFEVERNDEGDLQVFV